jgi:hypothetical protein
MPEAVVTLANSLPILGEHDLPDRDLSLIIERA